MPSKNLPLLMNYSYYAFNRGLPNQDGSRGDFQPLLDREGNSVTTFCNQAIQYIANGFGYDKLNALNANQIVAFMTDPVNGWISVSDEVAQQHANEGSLVIAGWSNPDGHGHVAVVIPGLLENSNNFKKSVPKILNIGREIFIGKRMSFGFTVQTSPTYYALCSTL